MPGLSHLLEGTGGRSLLEIQSRDNDLQLRFFGEDCAFNSCIWQKFSRCNFLPLQHLHGGQVTLVECIFNAAASSPERKVRQKL